MRWFVLLCVLSLTACTTPPKPKTDQPSWSGKLSLHIQSEPAQFFSAGFALVGGAEAGELELFTPLGTTAAQMTWNVQRTEVTVNGHSRYFNSPEQALETLSGAALPLRAVFSWLEGKTALPHPKGWTVDLSRQADGRISAKRSDPLPAIDLKVVLAQ